MAQLNQEINTTLLSIKQTLLATIDEATATEFMLFETRGETDDTIPFLDEMKNVATQARERYFQLSHLQIAIAEAQPLATKGVTDLLIQAIQQNQMRIPAWQRSIQEVKLEWKLS